MDKNMHDKDFFSNELKIIQRSIEQKKWPKSLIDLLADVAHHNFVWLSELKAGSDEVDEATYSLSDQSKSVSWKFITLKKLRSIVQQRKLRDSVFNLDLFENPAWNMLLELMQAHLEDTDVSVSHLCSVSGVPNTTALRWIERLAQAQLCKRVNDLTDRRRRYIILTEQGEKMMTRYLSEFELTADLASKP